MLLTLSSESNKRKVTWTARCEQNPLSCWSRKSLHFTGPETEKNRRRTSFIERADTSRGSDLANSDAGNAVTWPPSFRHLVLLNAPARRTFFSLPTEYCQFANFSVAHFFIIWNKQIEESEAKFDDLYLLLIRSVIY